MEKAGIEIGWWFVGGGVAKYGYKIGSRVIVGAEAAWVALCEECPMLVKLAERAAPHIERGVAALRDLKGKAKEVVGGVAEAASQTRMGQAVSKAAAKVEARVEAARATVVAKKESIWDRLHQGKSTQPKGNGGGSTASSSSSSTSATVSSSPRVDGKLFQDHHIISDKNPATKDHPLWKLAGVNPNDRLNKMLLPTVKGAEVSTTSRSIHQGRHLDHISRDLRELMDGVLHDAKGKNWTQNQYREKLIDIIGGERQLLKEGQRALNKHKRPWGATEKK